MSRLLILCILLFFCACDLDGPFNGIPCAYNLDKLHDTLKVYGLRSSYAAPKGFKSKEEYDLHNLDTSNWNIFLSIDSPNNLFFSELFVSMLARKVFDESPNEYFQHISFQLKQPINECIEKVSGTTELIYSMDRNTNAVSLNTIPTSTNAQITKKINEGYVSAGKYGNWRTVTLEIDRVPVNASQIAIDYRRTHQQFQEIDIFVKHVPSVICKSIKYQFWFGNDTLLRIPTR